MAVKKKRKAKPLLIILIILAILSLSAGITWMVLSSPIDKNNTAKVEVIIPNGTTTRQIGVILKQKGLIRSELFFNIYIKLNRPSPMKASTYTMTKNMSLDEIIKILESGNNYNPDVISITFKEGERITDFCKTISKKTNHSYDDAIAKMKDKAYIQTLISKYWFLSDEILNDSIYYPLEGYLAPNTYQFTNKDVSIEAIIETMLKQTDKILTKYKSKMTSPVHYYVTMASMAELEGTNTENRKQIVNVFENRLAKGMNLGSDVTTYYALQHPMNQDLTTAQFATVNPYNTRSTTMMGKMPIGPICNPSESSIEAALTPTQSTYLYFVADKYGKIYFTSTLAEHNAKVKEIKDKGDWIW
ncbi:MAG: endolytic transglycosylase MltG [Bacilli bacterium]|nr:endolytic transglycosylase MltG [Bacilli bacterium]